MVVRSKSFDTQVSLLKELDAMIDPITCLHHGDFSSVFYCRKKHSHRKVALKIVRFDTGIIDDDEESSSNINTNCQETFDRELQAVSKLNEPNADGESDPRDVLIVYFQESWVSPQMACILMNACDGGSLADDISRRRSNSNSNSTDLPYYTERRIAWYALQLCDALSFAHERGVAHHDVKSANVLINQSAGGTLVLSDFGGAVAPGEESVAFTRAYAPPELLRAHECDEYAGLRADKIDAFGIGCILFELISCQRLRDLDSRGRVLAQVIQEDGIDQALHLPCIKLPWLDDKAASDREQTQAGYSFSLGVLISRLLDPQPETRSIPTDFASPLRQDSTSPLLQGHRAAAKRLVYGEQLTMDNIQLGMFVQRGTDWDDGDEDGGLGSVGVVVKLDGDALFCEVAWPSNLDKGPLQHRIGAKNKFELQVGPTSIPDFASGFVAYKNPSKNFRVGHPVNKNKCVVTHVDDSLHFILVAPLAKYPSYDSAITGLSLSSLSHSLSSTSSNLLAAPISSGKDPPHYWEDQSLDLMQLIPVTAVSQTEYEKVRKIVFEAVDQNKFEISSVSRVQCKPLWQAYTKYREEVARRNWGVASEHYLFLSDSDLSDSETSLHLSMYPDPTEFVMKIGQELQQGNGFSPGTRLDHYGYKKKPFLRRGNCMILSRVTLGRCENDVSSDARTSSVTSNNSDWPSFHSSMRGSQHAVRDNRQVYPEYIIKLNMLTPRRRVVRVRRPETQFFSHIPAATASVVTTPTRESNSSATASGLKTDENDRLLSPAKVKVCVVCMTRAADRVLVPCGHVCLCGDCSSFHELARLNSKCPECRQNFREVIKIYSQVVEAE